LESCHPLNNNKNSTSSDVGSVPDPKMSCCLSTLVSEHVKKIAVFKFRKRNYDESISAPECGNSAKKFWKFYFSFRTKLTTKRANLRVTQSVTFMCHPCNLVQHFQVKHFQDLLFRKLKLRRTEKRKK